MSKDIMETSQGPREATAKRMDYGPGRVVYLTFRDKSEHSRYVFDFLDRLRREKRLFHVIQHSEVSLLPYVWDWRVLHAVFFQGDEKELLE